MTAPEISGSLLLRGRGEREETQRAEEAIVIDKRADCNQVTIPPQRAEGDLAICGCYEVEWTL